MNNDSLMYLAAIITLVGLMAYVVLGGADFGGGVWDLFAFGKHRREQREAIAHAMGPVWEANHVWLIFVLVMLITCWPRAYAALAVSLFLPFHLALLGIMLRGAAFVFRGYTHGATLWDVVFGASSIITPLLLGAAFGAVTVGPHETTHLPWFRPYSMCTGLLAVSTCAYLAAVYLSYEVHTRLREDFRTRAIIAGTTTAILALVVLYMTWADATWFFERLIAPRTWPILGAGLVLFALSAIAVFGRHYSMARWCAAGEIVCLLLGWAVAQSPYLAHPDYTIINSAGPVTTVKFVLCALPVGALVLVPSLWFLFRVFKEPTRKGDVVA